MWGQVLYLLLGTKVHDTLVVLTVHDNHNCSGRCTCSRTWKHDAWAARIDFICPAHTLLQTTVHTTYSVPTTYRLQRSAQRLPCHFTAMPHAPCPMPHAPCPMPHDVGWVEGCITLLTDFWKLSILLLSWPMAMNATLGHVPSFLSSIERVLPYHHSTVVGVWDSVVFRYPRMPTNQHACYSWTPLGKAGMNLRYYSTTQYIYWTRWTIVTQPNITTGYFLPMSRVLIKCIKISIACPRSPAFVLKLCWIPGRRSTERSQPRRAPTTARRFQPMESVDYPR